MDDITALRAEVERLKKEALFIAVSVLPEKDAQIDRLTARVAELEEALEVIATPKLLPSFGDPMVLRDYARASLTRNREGSDE